MLTTTPRLRIRRPSPTTAEFTVTDLPPSTLSLRSLRILLLLLRLILSLTTILVLHARWIQSSFARPLPTTYDTLVSEKAAWYLLACTHKSGLGVALGRLAGSVPLFALVPICVGVFYVLSLRVHTHESLLVLRGLGVQTSESPKSYLTSAPTRFIPTEKIQDIFVNEAFRGFEVRYYLVVVVEGEGNVTVVFPGLLPKREIVENVWRGARECLYERGRPGEEKS